MFLYIVKGVPVEVCILKVYGCKPSSLAYVELTPLAGNMFKRSLKKSQGALNRYLDTVFLQEKSPVVR